MPMTHAWGLESHKNLFKKQQEHWFPKMAWPFTHSMERLALACTTVILVTKTANVALYTVLIISHASDSFQNLLLHDHRT